MAHRCLRPQPQDCCRRQAPALGSTGQQWSPSPQARLSILRRGNPAGNGNRRTPQTPSVGWLQPKVADTNPLRSLLGNPQAIPNRYGKHPILRLALDETVGQAPGHSVYILGIYPAIYKSSHGGFPVVLALCSCASPRKCHISHRLFYGNGAS